MSFFKRLFGGKEKASEWDNQIVSVKKAFYAQYLVKFDGQQHGGTLIAKGNRDECQKVINKGCKNELLSNL